MELLDLPPEILSIIISFCSLEVVIETCRTLAYISFSTPSLWTHLDIIPSMFKEERLRKHLGHALTLPLTISIGYVDDDGTEVVHKAIVEDLCLILSEWNAQIKHIRVFTRSPVGAAQILRMIFNDLTPSVVFPSLRSLAVRFDPSRISMQWTDELRSALQNMYQKFPSLETLYIPTFNIPSLWKNNTFFHLCTLILDGLNGAELTKVCEITELLSNTPQLETLWMKNLNEYWKVDQEMRPRMPVVLLHLVRLAVSAPGTGTDLLLCLEAPALAYLHLDGRCPDVMTEWYARNEGESAVAAALNCVASRSPGLRHLAFTLLPVTQNAYETLFFGDQGRLLFPKLETLALHCCVQKYGLTEAVLTRLAQEGPKFLLRRLVLRCCESSFPGQTLIQMFQKAMDNAPNEKYELEVNYPCNKITDEEFNTLEEIGIKLFRRRNGEARIHQWWKLGEGRNDGSDSKVY